MLYLAIKAALSGIIIAIVSEVAKRNPGIGALIAANMAAHVEATFWFVLPSLPMFLLIPWLLRSGMAFWTALAIGCALTIALYLGMVWLGPRFGLNL